MCDDDIWDKLAVDMWTDIPDDIISDVQNNTISNDIIWDLIMNSRLRHTYENFSYQLAMKIYRITVYHNHENEMMTTSDFRSFESKYSRVKHQIKKQYKRCQNKKRRIEKLSLINFIENSEYKKEIYDILSHIDTTAELKKYDDKMMIENYINNIGFLPKITKNIQKSKNNVKFLDVDDD